RRTAERDFWRRRAEFLETHGRKGYEQFLADLEEAHRLDVMKLEEFVHVVEQANEPTVLPEAQSGHLAALACQEYEDIDGQLRPYLTDEETRFLTISKGSLDEAERLE